MFAPVPAGMSGLSRAVHRVLAAAAHTFVRMADEPGVARLAHQSSFGCVTRATAGLRLSITKSRQTSMSK